MGSEQPGILPSQQSERTQKAERPPWSPSWIRAHLAEIAILIVVLTPIWYLLATLVRLEAKVDFISDPNSPTSVMSAIVNLTQSVNRNTQEMHSLAENVFDLIRELHPTAKEEAVIRRYRDRQRDAGPRAVVAPLSVPVDERVVYARHSEEVPGMIDLIFSSEQQQIAVRAMLAGKVSTIVTGQNASKTIRLAHAHGSLTCYRLNGVKVSEGQAVQKGEEIGHITPRPMLEADLPEKAHLNAVLPVGLMDPAGRFIDPRPWLPPLAGPPQKQKAKRVAQAH